MPLPKKDFFSLPEVLAAWGCEYVDLQEFARTGALHFAIDLQELGDRIERRELADGTTRTTHHQVMHFVSDTYPPQVLAYLYDDDARRILAMDDAQCAVITVTGIDPLYVVGPSRRAGHLAGKKVFRRNVVITGAERARFEHEHGLVNQKELSAVAAVERIARTFARMHPVIVELRRRYANRALLIDDEYDFHDLLRALLRLAVWVPKDCQLTGPRGVALRWMYGSPPGGIVVAFRRGDN